MRILICAHEAPLEPFDGFRGAVASLVARLRDSNDVCLLSPRMPEQSAEAPSWMRLVDHAESGTFENAKLLARAIARRRPLRVDARAALLSDPLREELERFRPDVVQITSGRLAALVPYLETYPTVLAAFDAAHLNIEARIEGASRMRARLLRGEAERWKRFEATTWGRFDAVTVVTPEDGEALRAIDPRMPVHVIPNGIDAERFAPDPTVAREPARLLFHGVMDYAPNVSAAVFLAREVLPKIRATRPEAHLVIVGRNPSPEVSALAELENVAVTGSVPDVRPWLSGGSVYVCAMRSGTGLKNKLLEAMANGLPCVATPLATRGLPLSRERHLLVGEGADELAARALRVMEDPGLARRLGTTARAFVVEEYDWRGVARAYETLYRRIGDRHLTPSGEGS